MNEMIRRPADFSPKSSPRGSRSPVVPRQDSTGTLKTTISLGKTPAIVHSGPFYLMKAEPPSESELTGATNLISYHNLEHSYNKFCCGRKLKDQLSSFLPNLPGNIDVPADEKSCDSLRQLIEKPPIGGKELNPLTQPQLVGFRLHPGPLPEKYRVMMHQTVKKKHKHKKSKSKGLGDVTPSQDPSFQDDPSGHEKTPKHGKKRKHDEDKERKKKKKEKKRKKQKLSPERMGVLGSDRSV